MAPDNDILFTRIKHNPKLKTYLNLAGKRGVILVDRGFNHTDQVLQRGEVEAGYRIPGWLDGDKVFSSNEITSARATVEQFHGIWRRFTLFKHEIPMSQANNK